MAELTNFMREATESMVATVSRYEKDLNTFNNNMISKLDEVKRNMADIARNWSDGNFEAFRKIVNEKLAKLDNQIQASIELASVVTDTKHDFEEALKELDN